MKRLVEFITSIIKPLLVVATGVVLLIISAAHRGNFLPALVGFLAVVIPIALLGQFRDQAWREALARRRWEEFGVEGEQAFALFASHPDLNGCDPRVIRAVHDELQTLASAPEHPIPLRATDDLEKDLRIDGDDLDDIVEQLEVATGRRLGWTPGLPPNVVRMAADLVQCWSAAPMA